MTRLLTHFFSTSNKSFFSSTHLRAHVTPARAVCTKWSVSQVAGSCLDPDSLLNPFQSQTSIAQEPQKTYVCMCPSLNCRVHVQIILSKRYIVELSQRLMIP